MEALTGGSKPAWSSPVTYVIRLRLNKREDVGHSGEQNRLSANSARKMLLCSHVKTGALRGTCMIRQWRTEKRKPTRANLSSTPRFDGFSGAYLKLLAVMRNISSCGAGLAIARMKLLLQSQLTRAGLLAGLFRSDYSLT
jgi:hypothetical protein